jgi:hypothetical protein
MVEMKSLMNPGVFVPATGLRVSDSCILRYCGYLHNIADGGFLTWVCSQIINFNRIFHYKPSISRYPYFRKPSYHHYDLRQHRLNASGKPLARGPLHSRDLCRMGREANKLSAKN